MEMTASKLEAMASKEVVVKELLDILLKPHLPLCYIPAGYPSIDKQHSVAKQLHGVVLLYNYYHRKQYPQAEYLDFKSFRELVVTLKPFLEFHMNCKSQSDSAELDDSKNQFTFTIVEKAIQDACNLSLILDASKTNPVIEEWEISKVSVLFVDSKKENCFLIFGSVSDGVWSILEKDLEDSTSDSKPKGRKHTNKTNDSHLQRLAFLAVKDATGIRRSDLVILEQHVVYSLSKAKTTACFYIIQCRQPTNLDFQNPIEYVINSLQGPLVENSSGAWFTTPVVEYFHLLPYATIISTWFSGNTNSAKSSGKEVGASASSQMISKEKTVDERESSLGTSFPGNELNNVSMESLDLEKICHGQTKDATYVEVIEFTKLCPKEDKIPDRIIHGSLDGMKDDVVLERKVINESRYGRTYQKRERK